MNIYTDGSYRPSTKLGAYGVLIIGDQGERTILKGVVENTTNNVVELQAFIEALKYIKAHQLDKTHKIEIFSDSQYVVKGATEWYTKWKKNGYMTSARTPVKNLEQWKEVEALTMEVRCTLTWVKAHANNISNNEIDKIVFALTETKKEG